MINYKVSKCKNPNGEEDINYYSARAVKTGEYTFEDLAEDINNSTTVTQTDCTAVLRAMKSHITKALLSGQVVVLQDLGRLQVTLQSKCYTADAIRAEGFSPAAQIKGHRIIFRPEAKLKKEVKAGIALKRISSEAMA